MFSAELDESTDVVHLAQLLRYVHRCEIKTEYLFCKPLKIKATARDTIEVVYDLMVLSEETYVQLVWTEPLTCWAAGFQA
jgi:hypothetical protein